MNRESLKRHCLQTCEHFKRVPTSGAYEEHQYVLGMIKQLEEIEQLMKRTDLYEDDILLEIRSVLNENK